MVIQFNGRSVPLLLSFPRLKMYLVETIIASNICEKLWHLIIGHQLKCCYKSKTEDDSQNGFLKDDNINTCP